MESDLAIMMKGFFQYFPSGFRIFSRTTFCVSYDLMHAAFVRNDERFSIFVVCREYEPMSIGHNILLTLSYYNFIYIQTMGK